ncbi:YqhG family protein [Paenibacillus roseipurpureus]|uniref:YqhG family protein n=1 Tax=Paenibacillus roseopurpureus TaxID=2918901 RepID=A0AA96LL16_9BACL|nr:YqhG family protein [Paenibacillus sp. MBLB1832]WNR43062.1 YqhG family protein [Paenibacillus sp. MBLB1832]
MNKRNIHTFVMRFLETFDCTILEKTPSYVTVKLSPEADREMTGRPYYWSFIERTGAVAETMTYKFVFDPEQMQLEAKPKAATATAVKSPPPAGSGTAGYGGPSGQSVAGEPDSILGRYFGFVPTTITARVPQDEVTFGSQRLDQIFRIVRERGRFVHLFEEPFRMGATYHASLVYDTWFCVNYKVELACDRKRSEIHSLAIQLNSGEIREHFHKGMLTKSLSPQLPANSHILPDTISIPKAINALEMTLERKISTYDHRWADDANAGHRTEIDRVENYYNGLLLAADPAQRDEIETQCRNRLQEIDWQYKPRIAVSVINGGLFHLNASRYASRN